MEISCDKNAGDALLDKSGRSRHFQHNDQRTTGTAVSYAVPMERAAQRQHPERAVLRRSCRVESTRIEYNIFSCILFTT